jgi:hypothetical protein
MQPTRVGAIASFVLTVQFALTLLWILVAWPDEGLGALAASMSALFRENATNPIPFAIMNLYNVSFAVSALTLAVVLRRQFHDFPYRMDFVYAMAAVAGALYVASGMVPLVAGPDLVKAGNDAAVSAIEGVGVGLLLAGTMASGFAVIVIATVGFESKRLPALLCGIAFLAGVTEVIEWAVPAILILDPLLGTVWSVWLGSLLWADRVSAAATERPRLPVGEGTLS